MRALAVALVLAAAPAHAQLPGTADDPPATLAIVPSVASVPFEGFVVRGGTPEDTLVLLDGFELPRLQHFLGLRSVIPIQMIGDGALHPAPDASIGRAPTAVVLATGSRMRGPELEASTFELAGRGTMPHGAVAARWSVLDAVSNTGYFDAQLTSDFALTSKWRFRVAIIDSEDDSTRDDVHAQARFSRLLTQLAYTGTRWRGSIAASPLFVTDHRRRGDAQIYDVDRLSLDTRAELVRTASEAGGLTEVEWRLGEQTTMARHDLDIAWPMLPREGAPTPEHPAADDTALRHRGVLWTPDAALWTSLAANLAPHVRVTTGLRVDRFGRGSELAIQPRGELVMRLSARTRISAAAGAYRRAPQRIDELIAGELAPERTTQVTARIEHEHRALRLQGSAYYIDRTRLVIRDAFGELRNTGLGTAYGLELSAQLELRRWFVWVTGALSRSLRRDFARAAERPAQFDQPVRLSAIVSWRRDRWRVGGRLQLASGLPVTSIAESIYDVDRDVYEPIYGRTYDERLPVRYELALRVDRTLRLARRFALHAFADVRLSPSTLDYRYSNDYKERVAVTLPIVPFAGLRGSL